MLCTAGWNAVRVVMGSECRLLKTLGNGMKRRFATCSHSGETSKTCLPEFRNRGGAFFGGILCMFILERFLMTSRGWGFPEHAA